MSGSPPRVATACTPGTRHAMGEIVGVNGESVLRG